VQVILFVDSEHEVVVAHCVPALYVEVLTPADVQEECRLRRTEAGAERCRATACTGHVASRLYGLHCGAWPGLLKPKMSHKLVACWFGGCYRGVDDVLSRWQ
jgi:hypothetical protein